MGLITDSKELHAIVVGSSGGIGKAVTEALLTHSNVQQVTGMSRSQTPIEHSKFNALSIDILDEESISNAVSMVEPAQLIIIATGILHDDIAQPEKSLNNLDFNVLQRLFDVNTIGPALLIKHLSKKLISQEPCLMGVLSAKVGSISDNMLGGWYGYRASKAALNMIVKTAAIEVQRFHPDHCLVSLHPGTVQTALSDPFTANYPKDKLFETEVSAKNLLETMDKLGPANNGQFINWDGSLITF